MSLTESVVESLRLVGLDPEYVQTVVQRSIDEDLDGGVDVTSQATVPANQHSVLDLVARGSGVVAGIPVAAAVFDIVSAGSANIEIISVDGDRVNPGDVLVTISGTTRDLLLGERTALNLLCHLSGVATATSQWADALQGLQARVRDTRKTTPGLRILEKYAVRCGGGVNHRMSLSDAALVKDNHVVAAGGVAEAFDAVRSMWPGLSIEVEVDSLEELIEVLDAGADVVMLDNFVPDQMRVAVGIADEHAQEHARSRVILEASGGLTLPDAKTVGATGVDYIAVGALTHSAKVLDIGADLRPLT
jgi:nicotinate-nucleotide pyrophosphorylase (carboxylating)